MKGEVTGDRMLGMTDSKLFGTFGNLDFVPGGSEETNGEECITITDKNFDEDEEEANDEQVAEF